MLFLEAKIVWYHHCKKMLIIITTVVFFFMYDLLTELLAGMQPYLHESRHLHALNRVRGSGGRFLSTKKLQQSDPTSSSNRHVILDTIQLHQNNETTEHGSFYSRTSQSGTSNTTSSVMTSVSNDESIFRQSDHRFASLAAHIGGSLQSSGGLMCSGT